MTAGEVHLLVAPQQDLLVAGELRLQLQKQIVGGLSLQRQEAPIVGELSPQPPGMLTAGGQNRLVATTVGELRLQRKNHKMMVGELRLEQATAGGHQRKRAQTKAGEARQVLRLMTPGEQHQRLIAGEVNKVQDQVLQQRSTVAGEHQLAMTPGGQLRQVIRGVVPPAVPLAVPPVVPPAVATIPGHSRQLLRRLRRRLIHGDKQVQAAELRLGLRLRVEETTFGLLKHHQRHRLQISGGRLRRRKPRIRRHWPLCLVAVKPGRKNQSKFKPACGKPFH